VSRQVPFSQLRAEAIALRRAGRSRREIKELLAITSNNTLNEALKGEPPLARNFRPNARDDARARSRELREQGFRYNQIAAELGVSKNSVLRWVREPSPREPLSYQAFRARQATGVQKYWAEARLVREASRKTVRTAATTEVGMLSDREVIVAGAIAYWCEGAKNKPYRRTDRVVFMNSDPALIGLFLRFLDIVGVESDRLIYRIHIHESADAEAARQFWLRVTGAHPAQFRHATLKRHTPKTHKNPSDDYHGCLRIDVRQSASLYRKIEGWAEAAMASPCRPVSDRVPSRLTDFPSVG
jgi:predicted transcriptional regulator